MHEDLDITNYGHDRVRFQLEIASRSDFADIFEVKSGRIVRRGHITTHWSAGRQQLRTMYRNRDFTRALTIAPLQQKTVYANGRMSFEVVLESGAAWHCCLIYTLTDRDRHEAGPSACIGQAHKSHHAETLAGWLRGAHQQRRIPSAVSPSPGRYGLAAVADG
jgi:hypothetical protein